MRCNFKVQIILHQGTELETQQAAFGKHTTVLLDEVTEILLNGRIGNHDSFPKQCADLRAANVEHIAKSCNVRHCDVVVRCCQAISQSGTVHEQIKTQLPAGVG